MTAKKSATVSASVTAPETATVAAASFQSNEVDNVLSALMNPEFATFAVSELDQRVAAAEANLELLRAQRARLTGGVQTAAKRRAPKASAAKAVSSTPRSTSNTDHGPAITRALANDSLDKAGILQRLEAEKHEIASNVLSTYLGVMTKRGELLQTKISAKRATYKRNKSYKAS